LSSRAGVLVGAISLLLLALAVGIYAFPRAGSGSLKAVPKPTSSTNPTQPAIISPTAAPTSTIYGHVVLIVLENHSFETVIGNSEAPYLNSLANWWSLATGYSGVSHPSLPNYLAMIGGSTFGVTSDCTDCFVNAPSLPDRLDAAGKIPKAVVATHGHFDHIGAAEALCGSEIPFHIHKEDELALTDPGAWGAGFETPPVRPGIVKTFSDGDVLDLAGLQLEVLHTPGHTPGSSCFRIPGLLFSGDLVFRGSIGRFDFPNASEASMWASLRHFLTRGFRRRCAGKKFPIAIRASSRC